MFNLSLDLYLHLDTFCSILEWLLQPTDHRKKNKNKTMTTFFVHFYKYGAIIVVVVQSQSQHILLALIHLARSCIIAQD